MTNEEPAFKPLTRERILSEPRGPAWQLVTDPANLKNLTWSPGVYAHVTREHGIVLYVGSGIYENKGVRGRVRDELMWVKRIRDGSEGPHVAQENLLAGLAAHDFETWVAPTDSVEEALGWECYFQGLSWLVNRRLLPLRGWSKSIAYGGDWALDLLEQQRKPTRDE